MNLAFLSCDINVTVVSPSCNHTMTINSTIIHTQCSTFTPLEYIFLQVAIYTTHSGIQCVSKSSTCNRLYSGRTLWMEGLFQADKGNWKCLGWFYIGAIALPNTPFTWLCYALHSVHCAALFCGTIQSCFNTTTQHNTRLMHGDTALTMWVFKAHWQNCKTKECSGNGQQPRALQQIPAGVNISLTASALFTDIVVIAIVVHVSIIFSL